jgi:hypothetical protein
MHAKKLICTNSVGHLVDELLISLMTKLDLEPRRLWLFQK